MTLYIETPAGFEPWAGQPVNGIIQNRDIEQKWAAAELEEAGLYAPAPAADVPEGKRVVSSSVQRVGGVVRWVNVLADLTADELLPPLEKWRFWAVVNLPGSIGEANLRAAISGHLDPVFAALGMARLNDPPGGFYVRSDPMFSNPDLLSALGITEETVDTLWGQAHGLPG